MVWFWHTRQRSSSARSFRRALGGRVGARELGGLPARRRAAKASAVAATTLRPHAFSFSISGRMIFSSDSGVIGPICL